MRVCPTLVLILVWVWDGVISSPSPSSSSREWPLPFGHDTLFKFFRRMSYCHQDLVLVVQPHLEDLSLSNLRTFGIALSPLLPSFNQSQQPGGGGGVVQHYSPRCIAFLPHDANPDNSHRNFHRMVQRVDGDFGNLKGRGWIPRLMFIYPELFKRLNDFEPRERITPVFAPTSNFLLDSEVYTIFFTGGRDSLIKASIWESYSIKGLQFIRRLSPTFFQQRSKSTSKVKGEGAAGLELWHDSYDGIGAKVGRRGDFEGVALVASAKVDEEGGWAIVQKEEEEGSKLRLVGGTGHPWFKDLATMLNFSLEIIAGDSIITLPNNSLAGKTLEQLNSGEADLTLITALVVDFRAQSITFLQPFYSTLIYAFFRQPTANSIRNIVTVPFHPILWATIISTWLILILLVKVGSWGKSWLGDNDLDPIGQHVKAQTALKDNDFSANVGLWAIAATCQKSWYFVPASLPLKMTFLCGSLCGVLVYLAYSAAVVSTLATQSIPVEVLSDLLTHSFSLTVHNRSEPFQLILKDLIRLWRLRQGVLKVSTEEEISHLLDPTHTHPRAFLSYPDLFYQTALSLGYSDRFICTTLSRVRLSDFRYKTAMFLRKGSEYAEMFNHKILVLRERGFNFRYVDHYDEQNLFSCLTDRERARVFEPLDFHDTFTPFLVLGVGYLGALALLLKERICTRIEMETSRIGTLIKI